VLSLPELQAWEGSWSRDERMQVQRALQMLGHYNSGIDGVLGSGSRRAVSEFQALLGQPVTGYLSYYDRTLLALGAAEEAAQRAEAAATAARAAAAAPNAEEDVSDNGNVYLGDRNRQGYGTYTWAEGHRFEGQWNTTRQGFGVLTLANGWRFAGQWNDSVFVGFGIAEGTDGTYMAGEWNVPRGTALTDGLNGYGQIIADDGSEDFGRFANGILLPWGG
jgi:peptidoglycan hydrolase-like protein with peptidoglycan-binding domain